MPAIRFPSRRTLIIFLLIVVASTVAVVATPGLLGKLRSNGNAASAAVVPKTSVLEFVPEDLYAVRQATLTRTLPITGTLSAFTSATLKAKVAGELLELAAREGQTVKRGQLLARIDPTEARARAAARAADTEAARAQLRLAEKNQATQKALLAKNFISQSAFDTTQSGYDVALARLRATEADLMLAKKALGDSALYAPFSGIVSERFAQPGERVPLDARLISIVDLSKLTLEISLSATTIAQVRVGQAVAFRVDGFGERSFAGRIERINPATGAGSRSISVYALIENTDGLLRGGLFAQGELILERIENALMIPAAAVREEVGQTFVYAIEKDRLRRQPVKIGPSNANGSLQVLEGLTAGDRVVRSNLGQLRDSSKIQIRNRSAAASPHTAGN